MSGPVRRQGAEQLQPPARPADSPPSLEQVLDPLALGDPAGEQKSTFCPWAFFRCGPKPSAVGRVGDHPDLAAWRPVSRQRLGDVLRGHQDHVSQREVAEPALVQPVELGAVERAITQVDREELRATFGFLFENLGLLADVAVDHGENRGNAQPAAERQRSGRADVAEK